MRLFQIGHVYPAHAASLRPRLADCRRWEEALATLVREGPKSHLLKPALEGDPDAFLSYVGEATSLGLWAREQGMPSGASPLEVVLAQIEHHRAEVLYCMHGSALDGSFLDRLPGSVRHTVVWLGSPLVGDAYRRFDRVVSNFPGINRQHAEQGLKTAYFFPSHDPSFDDLGAAERDLDVVFIGSYTRHHRRRAELVEALAREADQLAVALHLNTSRYTPLADTPLGLLPPLSAVRRPRVVRRVAEPPVFGRAMFSRLARAKVVVNMAIDMAGADRGNIRCFETLSAGALLVSDAGDYPDGFVAGESFLEYDGTPGEAIERVRAALADDGLRNRVAAQGHQMIQARYGKERQWQAFRELVAAM